MASRSSAQTAVVLTALLSAAAIGAARILKRATRWGSTAEEQGIALPGDAYLEGGRGPRTVMTRAISIDAPREEVWPWLAQMGRGAGWYSYDRFDNGGKPSARHIVSWIPAPRIGDAAAVGWLRELEPGRALTWWLPGQASLATTMRMVVDIRLNPEGTGSRLIIRVSGDATGVIGVFVMYVFEAIDSVMAIRQLRGIKLRAELHGTRTSDPANPETGARDQFQLYEAIWVSGDAAGAPEHERAALWHRDAVAAGVVDAR